MAIYSSNDIGYSVIPETTAGVTPTTGSTRYLLTTNTGQTPVSFQSANIASNARRPNGASAGERRGLITGTGTIDKPLMAAPVDYMLFESLLRGKFTTTGTKTLKPGSTDTSFSLLSKINSDLIEVASGCYVTGCNLSATAGEGASVSFDVMSSLRTTLTADNVLVGVDIPATAREFTGEDFGTITVAGNTTLNFRELNLQIGQPRVARPKLGSNVSLGLGVSDKRTFTLTFKVYRESWALDTLLDGSRQAFSFNIGTTGGGLGVFMWGNAQLPSTSTDEANVYADVVVSGEYDATAAADIYLAQL